MSKVHLVLPDPHAHYQHHNNRALWAGELMVDVMPDVVVNIGDTWDMPSLSSFDKGKANFQGRSYTQDIDAGLDFHEKLWHAWRKRKRKLPKRVFLIGNHEQRIAKALNQQPELKGAIGFEDLQLDRYYDEVIYYNGDTPGVTEIDGVLYAHYFVSGILGRPVSSKYPADALVSQNHVSSTQGHSHLFAHSLDTRADGIKLLGLVTGCLQDYESDWAGECNKLWDRGIVVKRGVEKGHYGHQWIPLDHLKKEYEQRVA